MDTVRKVRWVFAALVAWVWGSPAALASSPGTCLQFNGTNGYVSVPHNAALNAYPLTITAWIKTLHNAPLYDGIVSKYPPAGYDGFSFFVYQGHARAWYFHNAGSYIWNPQVGQDGLGVDGGSVADGNWHQVAFVVNSASGSIYVDGNLGGSIGWTGSAGPPTTNTVALLIGRAFLSPSFTNAFAGEIDEVTFWNRALTPNELNYLKHRRLSGKEDGLAAYWRLDEGVGTSVGDSGPNGFNGTLVPNPAWQPSQAAIALEPIATNCLKFFGTNGYVQVAHNPDLNAYPFTATAWFRTTNTVSFIQGIVSKYKDASGEGWSLFVQNGLLRGFYYRQGTNRAIDFTYSASVADGGWHHTALTVDASGGKLWLDGVQVGSSVWQYAPGPPSAAATEPLQIGRYYTTYVERFQGNLDEITVWNRALTAGEIQTNRDFPLLGTESNLVAYWRLDEGTGTNAFDATGLGHTGTLISNAVWTGSTAYLGDGSVHLLGDPGTAILTRQYAVATSPSASLNSFAASTRAFFRRFYDFGPTPASETVGYALDGGLQVAGSGTPLAINPDTVSGSFSMTAYNASAAQPIVFGSVASISATLNLQPASGIQLDSVNNLHQALVTLSHNENGGAFSADGTAATDPARLLHFDGNLLFGSIPTTFTAIANAPTAGALSGGGLSTQLAVNNNSGTLTTNPAYHYGNGANLSVTLLSNGDALAATGTTVSLVGSDAGCLANICFARSGLTLSNNVVQGTITLQLPLGLSVCTNFSTFNHMTTAQVPFGKLPLDPASLNPQTNSLVASGPLYVVEETKPFWLRTPSLTWQLQAGQILLAGPLSALFVRQEDDDFLTASGPSLSETNLAKRISNDGYYRNGSNVLSGSVTILADTNGAAEMNIELALNPPELRPHFPYATNGPGGQIPTASGVLIISNGLIDTVNSSLGLAGPLPVAYARDCFDTNCSQTSIGPAILPFTTTGNALTFTPDGGLFSYGSVPPSNLTWGYAGNGNYAQQTSPVQAGAYHMPGTFLRFDQAPANPDPAAVLLFTGFGDDANPNYVERPGQADYLDGFANYAGLNFRAPAQGRSFIAQTDTDWYDLTGRSKYYVRFGGVSGIHEASSFTKALTLYGYPFTFQSYRLSFLDSDTWESRTDGALSLPVPAGFTQEFSRLKFVCKGDLESAQVPSSSGIKNMSYWHTAILPQSIEFYPTNDDLCGTSPRFLVLGVETRLPFLGEAFHATLGFKTNGNLVTSADNVAGCDSRFQVPGKLTLAGPGSSSFPLVTAGDGYFNNWETANKPENGFFNIAGKIRVPFFSDIKVHLQVTPSGQTNAGIDIMGGWPAADGNAPDLGWTESGKNFFNTAKFDRHADGWPQGIPLAAYRSSQSATYRPRAQRDWIDVAKFDYPLEWRSALHQFAGFAPAKVVLPVIDVNSKLKQLSPGKVDFDFAQDISLPLPALKVLDFANDALNELNGPLSSVSNAIAHELNGAFNAAGLTSGFQSLQRVLREDATGFFQPVVQAKLAPVAHQLYLLLAEMERTNPAALLANAGSIVTDNANGLPSQIQAINGLSTQAGTVFGQLDQALTDVDSTLELFLQVLKPDQGKRHVIRAIIQQLAHDQGQGVFQVPDLDSGLVDGLLVDLEPTLQQVESEMQTLRSQFADLHGQIHSATGDFSSTLQTATTDVTALNTFKGQAAAAVSNLLSVVVTPASNYFTDDPNAAEQAILNRLTLAFMSSPLPGNYQTAFRQFLADDNFAVDQLMNVLFDQINRSIRDGLENQIAGSNDGLFQAMKGVGQMSQSFLSAKIRGAPTFQGDSLRAIHLDAAVQLNLPDEMHFNAYMDIKEITSDTSPMGCIPAGAPAAEVTLGAKEVPLGWAGITSTKPLTLTVEGRWTLQNGSVLGIGGLFDIKGEAGFKGCSINEIGADFAIGELENYFAAKAAGTITVLIVPVDVQVGIFAGHSCSLDPLRFIDPNVDKVLDHAPDFSGLYLQYGGGLDLAEILFGSSSCWLDVKAGISTAVYYAGGPRSGKIGFRQQVSVDLDLACVISGHVDFSLGASASLTPPPVHYEIDVVGDANLCGSLGYCPICVEGCKGVTVKGIVNDGHIDYHIDGP